MNRQNKIIRFLICFAVVFNLCLGTAGCKIRADYQLVEIDGKHYLVFDDIFLYYWEPKDVFVEYLSPPYIDFDSLKDLKQIVTSGALTTEQKRIVARFDKDGKYRVKICDFENLYFPITPYGSSNTEVTWAGDYYYFVYEIENVQKALVFLHTEDSYQSLYEARYEKALEDSFVKVIRREYEDDGRKEITYYRIEIGGNVREEYKRVRYSLIDKNKTFHIDKDFRLSPYSNGTGASSTVPCNMCVYCEEGGQKYIIELRNLTEDPADEWLFQFGIQKYVDEK